MTATRTATSQPFASRLRAAVEGDQGSVPAHRRARNWHHAVERSVANPLRTRGLAVPGTPPAAESEDFAERLRRAVG
jgi:hypothetical protein